MKRYSTEAAVGVFLILGFMALAWMSVRLGGVGALGTDAYAIQARFTSVSGLKSGAAVEIAGVPVGKVRTIELDGDDYEALVSLAIRGDVKLQEDSVASIRTAGIIGDKYIKITPGGADEIIQPGGEIVETEASISLEELVSKYIFDSK